MHQHLIIDPSYHGPGGVGNGGYLSGRLAALYDRPVQVTLRRPPPLGRRLSVEWFEEVALLCAGEELIATAVPTTVDLSLPAPHRPPSYQEAVHATRFRLDPSRHPFPGCFVCGPLRAEGEGLRIFPGQVEGTDLVAAPWIPHAEHADDHGLVAIEFVHAALDCPGGFAAMMGREPRPIVLSRLAAHLVRPVLANERHIVIGWREGGEGRKHRVGTALYSADGRLCAVAGATWVETVTGARAA